MPTYRLSARNQFRSPSGAVGEAPDGPGALAALSDDVDNRVGIGGAEYCADSAAQSAIPSARLFLGKMAYRANNDTFYRYVGVGNTALAGNDTTHPWQAWSKPALAFTPAWTGIGFAGGSTWGLWGIADGLLWADVWTQNGGAASTPSNSADATLTLPAAGIAQAGDGNGAWYSGGSTAAGSQHDLYGYLPGAAGTSATTLRIRARVASAVGASVKQNPNLGSYITGAASDIITFHFRGPSGSVG